VKTKMNTRHPVEAAGNPTSLGLAALLAAELVDRCGAAALSALAERRDSALAAGDEPGAKGWRHVLVAAENLLGRPRLA
jgi:hypothetical protein